MKYMNVERSALKKMLHLETFIKYGLFHYHMKYLSFLTLLLVILCINISAQTSLSTADSTSVMEEKLVALALEGPAYKGSEHQNKINEYQLKSAKNSWLNLLTVSTNYNDQSFGNANQNASYVYPKYFFGVTIPLGTLFSRTGVKSAKEQVEISKDNQEQLARNIRADIISKYRQYKNLSTLIVLQSQAVDDEETAFLQAKEKFRNGDITIEIHNAAQKLYNDELAKKLGLQLQQDLLKIEIERIIGTTLEDALK